MARSRITFTFTGNLEAGDFISFNSSNSGQLLRTYRISWVDQIRDFLDFNFTSLFGILTMESMGFSVPNYDAKEFEAKLDNLNFADEFQVSRVLDVVTVTSNSDNTIFENLVSQSPNVTVVISNETTSANDLNISDISISEASSNPCDYVTVTVTTSKLAGNIVSPLSDASNSDNPFSFQYLRGQKLKITVSEGLEIQSTSINTPQKLSDLDLSIDVVYFNSDNTVTVNYSSLSLFFTDLNLQYSLDNVSFSSNNVFNNLPEGIQTIYVKDELGCTVSKEFEIESGNEKEEYNYISKTNSIRFARRESWDGINIHKNDENTLSGESMDGVRHCDLQRFQLNDIIKTQMRSNFDSIEATVIEGDSRISLPVSKAREFLGLKDHRDCVIFNFGNNKTGIYFISGSKYDYDNSTKTGDYTLNGVLPVWFKVGSEVILENVGVLEIKSIFFDEEKGVEVAEIAYNYSGLPTLRKVKTIYNIRPFNLFEFSVDFSSFEDKYLNIEIKAIDSELDPITWISELIQIKEVHEDCLEIKYHNEKNGDIFYETGIRNLIRIPLNRKKDNPISESEIHKGDDKVSLTRAEYYEGDEFEFFPISKELSKKLELALKHTQLTLSGVGYRLYESPEKNALDDSNLYVIKAKMIKAGSSYNTNSIVDADDNISIDVPAIINTNNSEFLIS